MPDGVYVDASYRNGQMTLGFVEIKGNFSKVFSIGSNQTKVTLAEREAVQLAKQWYPGQMIYSDCEATCKRLGAIHIRRCKNQRAHRAAYRRINYQPIRVKHDRSRT